MNDVLKAGLLVMCALSLSLLGGCDDETDTLDEGVAGSCESPIVAEAAGEGWAATGTTLEREDLYAGSCSDEPGPEFVVSWTAPAAGLVTAAATGPDPVLSARAACGDISTELACNDDRPQGGTNSEVTFFADAGATYWFIVDSYDFESVGETSIEVSLDTEAVPPEIPEGIWVARGYGMALDLRESDYTLYEWSDVHCMDVEDGRISQLSELIVDMTSTDVDVLSVLTQGSVGRIIFDRLDELPEACRDGVEPVLGDADYVFDASRVLDIVWHAFDEHFPFFELRDIDWNELGDAAEVVLGESNDEGALFDAIVSLMEPLHDGHVSLSTPDREFLSKPFLIDTILHEQFDAQTEIESYDAYYGRALSYYFGAINEQLDGPGDGAIDGMYWGRIGDIGYLRIISFSYVSAAEMAIRIDEPLQELSDTDGLVLDLRVNGGGSDDQSIEVASRFTTERVEAFTKAARFGDSFAPPTTVYVDPADEGEATYAAPVVLLVSGSTVSAAEIFTLAMREIDTVTVMGQNTSGELSDILGRQLPNGWWFGLSNEVYTAADGEVYEMVGVPPDVEIEYDMFAAELREAGEDPALEDAVDYLLGAR